MTPPAVVLLGPQYHAPTAGAALRDLGLRGRAATITAGWQEREAEDEALERQLPSGSVPLRLYERALRVWDADSELRDAHQEMQADLRTVRGFYHRQLEAAASVWVGLLEAEAPERLLGPEREAALEAIQRLDAHLLERVGEIRAAFEAGTHLLERKAVRVERAAITELLRGIEAVVIEGGHVAVLLNRMSLFGMHELIKDKVIVGCAGGAMALCRRIVLYDDSPAIGRGHAEVALPGLGFALGVVALPDAAARLRHDDPQRMLRLSRRLAPETCVLLDEGGRLVWDGRSWSGVDARLVLPDGTLRLWESAA